MWPQILTHWRNQSWGTSARKDVWVEMVGTGPYQVRWRVPAGRGGDIDVRRDRNRRAAAVSGAVFVQATWSTAAVRSDIHAKIGRTINSVPWRFVGLFAEAAVALIPTVRPQLHPLAAKHLDASSSGAAHGRMLCDHPCHHSGEDSHA